QDYTTLLQFEQGYLVGRTADRQRSSAVAWPHAGARTTKQGPIHSLDDRFCEEGYRPEPDYFDLKCHGGIGLRGSRATFSGYQGDSGASGPSDPVRRSRSPAWRDPTAWSWQLAICP